VLRTKAAIEQRIDEPPLLIGTMTPTQALAVARLDNVALVEQDEGGVHAIEVCSRGPVGIAPGWFPHGTASNSIFHCA
jgi:hypothetical protein